VSLFLVAAVAAALLWMLCLHAGLSVFRRRVGITGRLRLLTNCALLGAAAVAVTSGLIIARLFDAFAGETLVATVTTVAKGPSAFELEYLPAASGGEAAQPLRIALQGDQWVISGGIIKWHRWLTALGLKSYHKPMRLAGQFSQFDRQQAAPSSVYALHRDADRVWEAFYWAAPRLPMVDAVYGSGAYVYAEPGVAHQVYVTHSGYMVKRVSKGPGGF
jgi:hypothetical protein